MEHYDETILKFVNSLNVDLIKDVRFQTKSYGNYHCVCGQRIKRAYIFKNIKNHKTCVVGYHCLQYVADYLEWN